MLPAHPKSSCSTYTSNRIAEQTTTSPAVAHKSPQRGDHQLSRVIGSTNFHAKFINWSCRSRGKVPRTQIKTQIDNITLEKNQIHEDPVQQGKRRRPAAKEKCVPNPEIDNMARYSRERRART